MEVLSVRISSIKIKNFKNVKNGELDLKKSKKMHKSRILGLYGQNGSGKTALIDALELLKYNLCGREVPEKFVDYINVDAEIATLEFKFDIEFAGGIQTATYEFSIRSRENFESNMGNLSGQEKSHKIKIFGESLKCFRELGKVKRIERLIDTDVENLAFVPHPKRNLLIGKDKITNEILLYDKIIAGESSRSFAFSPKLLEAIREKVKHEKEKPEEEQDKELLYYHAVIESLVNFGNTELFVINTANSGMISLNAQPVVFKYQGKEMRALGMMAFSLDEPITISEKEKLIVDNVIENMNIVLKQIIPNLTIGIRNLGIQSMKNGEVGYVIQFMSGKNSKEIALKYESEGIKKIISVLQLLIVVYNSSSITVAIDELDSGIFEYLLGELLRIISEKGKGQLIFTSHNLRPLETLDKSYIAFTTTNPHNRYVRMKNVKENNNLRALYYRDIMLGSDGEELYDISNNAEIAFAFREAGEYIGS